MGNLSKTTLFSFIFACTTLQSNVTLLATFHKEPFINYVSTFLRLLPSVRLHKNIFSTESKRKLPYSSPPPNPNKCLCNVWMVFKQAAPQFFNLFLDPCNYTIIAVFQFILRFVYLLCQALNFSHKCNLPFRLWLMVYVF